VDLVGFLIWKMHFGIEQPKMELAGFLIWKIHFRHYLAWSNLRIGVGWILNFKDVCKFDFWDMDYKSYK
jgi:hypothetical protein